MLVFGTFLVRRRPMHNQQGEEKMRRAGFIVFVLVIWLATCKAPEPKAPSVAIASRRPAITYVYRNIPGSSSSYR